MNRKKLYTEEIQMSIKENEKLSILTVFRKSKLIYTIFSHQTDKIID